MAWYDPISIIITQSTRRPSDIQWYAALQAIIDKIEAMAAYVKVVSTSSMGLCPQLDGNINHFLRSDGVQAAPPGSGGVGGATGDTDEAILLADGVSTDTIKTSNITIETTLTDDDTKVPTSGAVSDALTARATKTTAAMSVYVDAAATGAADGTSWTDAFTTIQAAINSLPTVLEHAVTIYVRKESTEYNPFAIQQIIGKGSLEIRGEYYWHEQCAAAETPSTTKFNITAADGAQIEAGDIVVVTDGNGGSGAYKYYTYSTVKATVDKGSNVWEIEVNDALDSGNIGTGDYYTIIKTKISGYNTIINTSISLTGLAFISGDTAENYALLIQASTVTITSCSIQGTGNDSAANILMGSKITTYSSYYEGYNYAVVVDAGKMSVGNNTSNSITCVFVSTNSLIAITASGALYMPIYRSIINCSSGTGISFSNNSVGYMRSCTICSGTTTGIKASMGANVTTLTLNNNATTPKDPASSTDTPHIA